MVGANAIAMSKALAEHCQEHLKMKSKSDVGVVTDLANDHQTRNEGHQITYPLLEPAITPVGQQNTECESTSKPNTG